MQTEIVGDYEIEYSGVHLPNCESWGAWLTVYGPSHNPMHRNPIFPGQRVSPESRFDDEQAAEQEAKKIAHALIEGRVKKN
ncbi:MAG: hypothetical protein JWP38_825 [Herbaspirillum sp.]|jgi:hypothetical protein|nr:hypothetical protein [Herbaspirillum sp.]